jgi:hypothetical protein
MGQRVSPQKGSGGPTGFTPPTSSTQETGHGYQDMEGADGSGYSQFTQVPLKAQSQDGYGSEDAPGPTGELGHQGDGYGYDTKVL